MKSLGHLILSLLILLITTTVAAQPVTGYWKGKINGKKVEVKMIKNGDSLTGTSYYYTAKNSYRRYTIKGYFDNTDNSVVWWDDALIEEKNTGVFFTQNNYTPYLSAADFNCPGGTKMFLQGVAALKENKGEVTGSVDLEKIGTPVFKDEWNFVIDNYVYGANDPVIIDSVGKIAFTKPAPPSINTNNKPEVVPTAVTIKKPPTPVKQEPVNAPVQKPTPVIKEVISDPTAASMAIAAPAPTIEEKFTARRKLILKEIPVQGDSIELRFYDNAEVDGDSISIFLNNRLLYKHIRLTEKAYSIKLAVDSLQENNELIMVAENLGSIPPNTAFMVCIVGEERYETRMESTEQSSAGIRFVRRKNEEK